MILRRLVGSKSNPSWTLPNGRTCERSGSRRTDLVLAWAEDETSPLDEGQVKGRWPAAQTIRRLGRNLFLVYGITPEQEPGKAHTAAAPASILPPVIPSLQLAAHALAEARQVGDRARETTALIDLAVAYLHKLEAQPAASLLEEALAEARQLGERDRELDAMLNYAQAVLILGRPQEAVELLGPVLAAVRETGDRYSEKVALERLGHAHHALGDHAGALNQFEQALAIARHLGDAQHEATLLWYVGIAYAELGRTYEAMAQGEESVKLLHRLNNPQAMQYAQHLADYRSSLGSPVLTAQDGGIFDASVITINPQPQASNAAGPGLLRMALTASQAAVAFASSGLKTVPVETYRARLQQCSHCDMFTGLRCRVCGCIPAVKARLPHEDCPAGKWSH
jgi:tetratricopeptide (TPR) repeat protein